jgi:hypothetical protein
MGLLLSTFLAQETHQIEILFCIIKSVLLEMKLDFLNILLSATNERILFPLMRRNIKVKNVILHILLRSSETARQRGVLKKRPPRCPVTSDTNYPVT